MNKACGTRRSGTDNSPETLVLVQSNTKQIQVCLAELGQHQSAVGGASCPKVKKITLARNDRPQHRHRIEPWPNRRESAEWQGQRRDAARRPAVELSRRRRVTQRHSAHLCGPGQR
jgi:hypothetical protein